MSVTSAELENMKKRRKMKKESTNPKDVLGKAKPPMHFIPPIAIVELGQAMKDGGAKYGLMNWRGGSVDASVYYDAAMRHILAWWDGEEVAKDSGVKHLTHAMACFAIILDAQACDSLNDDRPIEGAVAQRIEELTNV